jgi:CRISPR/Cas system-associated endoribonuclease Cas2
VVASAEEALTGLPLCGATVAIGGFGLCGIPETLISSLANNSDAQSLTTVALTAGVDGFGIGMNELPLTIQVKFRSDSTTELIEKDIKQFAFQSIVEYNVDKDTRTNMIVFTNSKGLHWITESKVFSGRVRSIGYDIISQLIDNNSVFWRELNDLIKQTISEKYI